MRAVVDTSALASFIAAAREVSAGQGDPVTAWEAYERGQHEVFARYFAGWGKAERRPAAAAAMVQTAERLTTAGLDWPGLLQDVAARMTALVPTDHEIPVVVFVGMGTSNGWVTQLRGQETVFLAAELAAPPPFDAVLIAHELTHALQYLMHPGWAAEDYALGALAFAEGLGTYVSALAYPGHGDNEYLWVDASHREWLRDCEQAWPTAAAALRDVADEPCGGAAERQFFSIGSSGEIASVPSRFGYYAGLRVVRDLATEMSPTELLALDVPQAQTLLRRRLDELLAQG
jgi:hypothetical protein